MSCETFEYKIYDFLSLLYKYNLNIGIVWVFYFVYFTCNVFKNESFPLR